MQQNATIQEFSFYRGRTYLRPSPLQPAPLVIAGLWVAGNLLASSFGNSGLDVAGFLGFVAWCLFCWFGLLRCGERWRAAAGVSSAILDHSWGTLVQFLSYLGAILGHLGAISAPLGSITGHLGLLELFGAGIFFRDKYPPPSSHPGQNP